MSSAPPPAKVLPISQVLPVPADLRSVEPLLRFQVTFCVAAFDATASFRRTSPVKLIRPPLLLLTVASPAISMSPALQVRVPLLLMVEAPRVLAPPLSASVAPPATVSDSLSVPPLQVLAPLSVNVPDPPSVPPESASLPVLEAALKVSVPADSLVFATL